MNREIKFRAWDKEKKAMHNVEELAMNEIGATGVGFAEYGIGGSYKFELMQYTGLKDKNGKEIYEGDIVAIDIWQGNENGYIPESGVINWHDRSSAFKWLSGDPSDGSNYWLSQADEIQREIIGNIYENKDLLEEAANA